jgi:hypothetical protein
MSPCLLPVRLPVCLPSLSLHLYVCYWSGPVQIAKSVTADKPKQKGLQYRHRAAGSGDRRMPCNACKSYAHWATDVVYNPGTQIFSLICADVIAKRNKRTPPQPTEINAKEVLHETDCGCPADVIALGIA